MHLQKLFDELRRRRVFAALAWYFAAAWVALQLVGLTGDDLGLPGWTLRALVIAAAVGVIPIALLAWAFDLSAKGLERAGEPAPSAPASGRRGASPWLALIAGVLLVAGGYNAWSPPEPRGAVERVRIAVLPLGNVGGDAANAALVDGLHVALIDELSSNPNLAVTTRASVVPYAGTIVDYKVVERDLGAHYLLEGDVQREGERLHLSIRLTDARSKALVWRNDYHRPLGDAFVTQRELAGAVADALDLAATPEDLRDQARPVDPRAVELYLKMLASFNPSWFWDRTGSDAAIEALDEAVRIDPSFAEAYAALASVHAHLARSGTWEERGFYDTHMPLARAALARADAIDPNLFAAQTARFRIATIELDRRAMAEAARRMLALRPSDPDALRYAAKNALDSDAREDALAYAQEAIGLDPRSFEPRIRLAMIAIALDRLELAREALAQAKALGAEIDTQLAMLRVCETGEIEPVRDRVWARGLDGIDWNGTYMLSWKLGDTARAVELGKTQFDRVRAANRQGDPSCTAAGRPCDDAVRMIGYWYAYARLQAGLPPDPAASAIVGSMIDEQLTQDVESRPPSLRHNWIGALGQHYAIGGFKEEARAALAKAETFIAPDDDGDWATDARYELAEVYALIGDYEKATAMVRRVLVHRFSDYASCPWSMRWRGPFQAMVRDHEPFRALLREHGVDLNKGPGGGHSPVAPTR